MAERPDWQAALEAALPEAASATPASAVLAGRAGGPGEAEALTDLHAWFVAHASSPCLDATGDDGALACALAAAAVDVAVWRTGRAAETVRRTVEGHAGPGQITLVDHPPDEAACVAVAGEVHPEALPDGDVPLLAAVDADGLAALAQHCEIDAAELTGGLARLRGRLVAGAEPGPLADLASAALDAARRAQAAAEQDEADAEDRQWRIESAERRAAEAERAAREAAKATRRAERRAERAETAAAEARRAREEAHAALETARRAREEAEAARDRERALRERMRERRWWRLGEALASARGGPRAWLRLPGAIARALRRR